MADYGKVIAGLHCCSHTDGTNCIYCPYDISDSDCTALMSMDVLELLKEQEAVKPKIDAFGHPYCPKCKILVYETWEFCPHCGQAVKRK